jgi:hypothetical protein
MCVCVCVCVCECTVCLCVCLCMCVLNYTSLTLNSAMLGLIQGQLLRGLGGD